MPRLTVLMPTYNVATYINEAINSVLLQTFKDFELLVVDDGSTDETLARVRAIDDQRIRIAAFNNNVGLAENLNRGLDLIDTELVARMDGDDIAEPDWLETGIKVLDTHPEVGICSFGFQFFGTKTSIVRFPEFNEDSKAEMLFGCTVIVPVFRKAVFTENNLRYHTDTFPAEDYSLWAEAYHFTQVYNVQRTLFYYRTHPTQISTSRRLAQIEKSNEVRLRMLLWLTSNLTCEDKVYFTKVFISPKIESKQDLKKRKVFAKKLIILNRVNKNYTEDSLRQCFKTHLTNTLCNSIIERFFFPQYSLCQYWHYLHSGLALKTNWHNEFRFLLKCLLYKK